MPKRKGVDAWAFGDEDYATSSFMNECFRGFGYYAYHTKALEKLSSENRDLFLTTYQESLGLPEVNLSGRINGYIDNYQKARIAAFASLPDGTAFEENPKRLQTLSASFNTLDSAIQNIGAQFHPDNLTQYIEEERQKAMGSITRGVPPDETHLKGAIIQQYEEDVNLIERTITDPLKKKSALTTLNAAHQAQLKTLEEGFKKDTDALHKAVEKERLRVSTFAVLRHESEEMKKKFDQAYLKTGSENTTLSMGGEGGVFKDLDFDSLVGYVNNNFKTLTGRDLQVVPTGDNPKTYQFSLALPNISKVRAGLTDLLQGDISFSSLGYYSDPSNRAMQDMLTMATLLKLSGEEKPYAEIKGFSKNPEMAMKHAQDAFAALRMAGYAEDAIKIIVNGKAYTLNGDKENNFEALFKTNPGRRQEVAQLVSTHQRKGRQETFGTMKTKIEAERKKYEGVSAPAGPEASSSAAPASEAKSEPGISPIDDASKSVGKT